MGRKQRPLPTTGHRRCSGNGMSPSSRKQGNCWMKRWKLLFGKLLFRASCGTGERRPCERRVVSYVSRARHTVFRWVEGGGVRVVPHPSQEREGWGTLGRGWDGHRYFSASGGVLRRPRSAGGGCCRGRRATRGRAACRAGGCRCLRARSGG